MDNFYINQATEITNKLTQGITILNDQVKVHIDKIREELIKTGDYTAEPHIQNCESMSNKIRDELIEKINKEIDFVKKEAEKWQSWYNNMKSIEGNGGYSGAKAKGFYTEEEEILRERTSFLNKDGNYVEAPSSAASFNHPFNPRGSSQLSFKTETYTVKIYYWTAYTDVTINQGNGYIDFTINNYKSEDNQTTIMGSSGATIASDADYDTYYNGRGSIGGKG